MRGRGGAGLILAIAAVGALGAPAWAQGLEKVPAGETAEIDAIRDRALAELRKHYPEGQQTLVRRDAHAKPHGCVKATFEVDPALPQDLRVGTFSQPGQRFKALVRFSNGNFTPSPDTSGDGRGMAIKIIDTDPAGKTGDRQRPPHDILMINYPSFFSRNVADYKDFADAGGLTGDTWGLVRYFAAFRIDGAMVAASIVKQEVTSPLAARYFSMAPFQFGDARAVKYSARACPGSAPAKTAPKGPDFLREALWAQLASAPACFELMVQERKGDMKIEDVVPAWSETESAFRRVGKIEIAAQANTPQREQTCEGLTFNPGHTPAEQRPLGGINRLRKVVYDAISAYRNQRNGVTAVDPGAAWDTF